MCSQFIDIMYIHVCILKCIFICVFVYFTGLGTTLMTEVVYIYQDDLKLCKYQKGNCISKLSGGFPQLCEPNGQGFNHTTIT